MCLSYICNYAVLQYKYNFIEHKYSIVQLYNSQYRYNFIEHKYVIIPDTCTVNEFFNIWHAIVLNISCKDG